MTPRFHFDPLRRDLPETVTRDRLHVWVTGWGIWASDQNEGRRIFQMQSLLKQLEGRFPARRRPMESGAQLRLVDELWDVAREFACNPTEVDGERDRVADKARRAICRDLEHQIEAMGLHRTARSQGVREHLLDLFDRARKGDHEEPLRESFALMAAATFQRGLGAVPADRRSESLRMCLEEVQSSASTGYPARDQDAEVSRR